MEGNGTLSRLRRNRLIRNRRPLVWAIAAGMVVIVAVVTLATIAISRQDTTRTLVEPSEQDLSAAELRLDVTLTSVDAQTGELGVRALPVGTGSSDGWVEAGIVTRSFRLSVNAIGGQTIYTFDEGQPAQAIDYEVALSGGSVFGYPFDRYRAPIFVLPQDGTAESGADPVPTATSVTTTLPSFTIDVEADEDCRPPVCVPLEVSRPLSTTGYVLWFVVLVWGLALGGLAILYTVARRGVDVPLWSFGYLVGVLFALPPLRSSLPNNPPAGGLVDYLAFYWAVAVVGLTLMAMIGVWVRESSSGAPD